MVVVASSYPGDKHFPNVAYGEIVNRGLKIRGMRSRQTDAVMKRVLDFERCRDWMSVLANVTHNRLGPWQHYCL